MLSTDTICAIATPAGNGAIALLRLSGQQAIQICESVFTKVLSDKQANTLHYGTIIHESEIIDDVVVSLFLAPHSFTGEDTVEVSCHGSVYIQQRLLELFIKKGARLAQPGEFTQRAFLHGKMDLSQAEAVADIIAASSEASHKLAFQQLRGNISDEIAGLRSELLQFVSLIELELDFSEEDVLFADRKQLLSLLTKVQHLVQALIKTFATGNAIKKGIPVAIVGKPNVGKSTLLNLLLKEDRAIVSDIAGTTRDVIEDVINIGGYNFRLIDTAGLRKTEDKIESIGIQKTLENIEKAQIVLKMADFYDDIPTIKKQIERLKLEPSKALLIVLNKVDEAKGAEQVQEYTNALSEYSKHIVAVSAKHNKGTEELNNKLIELSNISQVEGNDTVLTNTRHYEAFLKTNEALERVLQNIEQQLPTDLLAQDIREAMHYLGEVTGEITTEEILGNIFKNFCIGK